MKTFAIPYFTDERLNYTADYLKNNGFEYVESVDNADFIILPIPAKEYMFKDLENKTVFYGAGKYKGIDYGKDECFMLENAYLTAEGAVALYKENSESSLYGSRVLITGYGRIAKALHRILKSMGADVTICARSDIARIEALHNGANLITFEELKYKKDFDTIFNTVPHIIFTKNELDGLKRNTLLIDLASFPGGVDTLIAKSKGINLIDGRKLPSKYSKITAGVLIGKTIEKIIKEDFSWI